MANIFLILCLIILSCSLLLLLIPEKSSDEKIENQKKSDNEILEKIHIKNNFTKIAAWLFGTVINPLLSFFNKNSLKVALAILGFVFFLKLVKLFRQNVSSFYKEIGFSKTDIAIYSKGIGWLTTIFFTLAGGLFAVRMGLVKAMFVSGIFMASTNLFFSLLAWVGDSKALFAFAVLIDDLAAAFATVAFVGFISALVDRNYTATQYALLASIGTAGRTLFCFIFWSFSRLVKW